MARGPKSVSAGQEKSVPLSEVLDELSRQIGAAVARARGTDTSLRIIRVELDLVVTVEESAGIASGVRLSILPTGTSIPENSVVHKVKLTLESDKRVEVSGGSIAGDPTTKP